MVAANASASLYLYESRCFSSPYSPFSSKSASKTHQFVSIKPISRRPISSLSSSNSFNSTIRKITARNSRFPFVYASLSNQEPAHQTGDGDENLTNEPGTSETKTVEPAASLESLLLAYKAAVLEGDENVTSEIEAMASLIEEEKNQLVERVSTLSAEISSGKDKYLRLQADFDNFRKRSEKERLTTRSNARKEVIECLLPMVDNFERAKQQIKLETDQEKKINASYQGIYKQFVEIMRSLQVAVVSTVGKPFDPLLHEAIAREESQEFKEGIITQEFRRGFLLEGHLIRPAMVKVSSGPGKKQPASVANASPDQQTTAAGVDQR